MRKIEKIAVAAAGLVLAGGAAAAAVTAPPQAASTGLDIAEEHTGIELPASKAAHPSKDDHPGGPGDEVETIEGEVVEEEVVEEEDAVVEEEDESDDEGTGPVDSHGAEVSTVAKDDSTVGRAHGEAVSAVARGDHGAPEDAIAQAPVATPNEGGTGTASAASGGRSDVGTSRAASQAGAGSANAGAHRP